jgi:hypothetical protein
MINKFHCESESVSEEEINLVKKEAKKEIKEEIKPVKEFKEIKIEKKIAKDEENNAGENILPTEGVKDNDPKYKKNKNIAVYCEYCNTFYDKRMIAKCEFGDVMCQHCYFFLNFADPHAKYGWTLEKYIDLCQHEHDKTKCQKFANGGGCHLCLYLCDMESINKNATQSKTNLNQKVDTNSRKIIFSDESQKDKFHIACDEMIVL